MIQLIFYGILAAAVVGGYAAWHHSIYKSGVDAQLKLDQPKMDALSGELAQWKESQAKWEKTANQCFTTAKDQSDAINLLESKSIAQRAKSKQAVEQSRRAAAQHAGKLAEYEAIVSDKSAKAQTCEEKLSATDKLLRDAARARAQTKAAPK